MGALVSPGTKSAWVCVVTGPVGKKKKKKQEMLKYENIFLAALQNLAHLTLNAYKLLLSSKSSFLLFFSSWGTK